MRLDIYSCQDKREVFMKFTLALSFQVLLRLIENDCHAKVNRKGLVVSDLVNFRKRS